MLYFSDSPREFCSIVWQSILQNEMLYFFWLPEEILFHSLAVHFSKWNSLFLWLPGEILLYSLVVHLLKWNALFLWLPGGILFYSLAEETFWFSSDCLGKFCFVVWQRRPLDLVLTAWGDPVPQSGSPFIKMKFFIFLTARGNSVL